MHFDPFSPPPLPQNEHEARIVGVIFVCMWSLTLLFLYWQLKKNEKEEKSQAASNQDKDKGITE